MTLQFWRTLLKWRHATQIRSVLVRPADSEYSDVLSVALRTLWSLALMTFSDVFSWKEWVSFVFMPNFQYLTIKIFDLDMWQISLGPYLKSRLQWECIIIRNNLSHWCFVEIGNGSLSMGRYFVFMQIFATFVLCLWSIFWCWCHVQKNRGFISKFW